MKLNVKTCIGHHHLFDPIVNSIYTGTFKTATYVSGLYISDRYLEFNRENENSANIANSSLTPFKLNLKLYN